MADLQIETRHLDDEVILLELAGFLDAHTFEQLEAKIEELFENDAYQLVVNLNELEYISSAGAGVFIGAIGTAQDNGGNIVLVSPSENVREVFDLLGLTQIFPIVDSAEEASTVFHQTEEAGS